MAIGMPNILIVEDSNADARLLEIKLESGLADSNVQRVATLREALECLTTGTFDVVLLDLGLPDSAGLDAFESLAAAGTLTPIVIVTGFDDDETAARALELGAQDYLVKDDATPEMLRRTIAHSVGRQRRLLEVAGRRSAMSTCTLERLDTSVWLG